MKTQVKMFFELEQDDEGYPPVNVESLWVSERLDGLYEIDNIPFFVRDIALSDIVFGCLDENNVLWFQGVAQPSRHRTLRVLTKSEHDVSGVRDALKRLGCSSEGSHIAKLISVDVPPNVIYDDLRAFLDEGEANGQFEYEESCLRQ